MTVTFPRRAVFFRDEAETPSATNTVLISVARCELEAPAELYFRFLDAPHDQFHTSRQRHEEKVKTIYVNDSH